MIFKKHHQFSPTRFFERKAVENPTFLQSLFRKLAGVVESCEGCPDCCDPNIYGYVKKFTIDDIVVMPTGDPDIFDVTVNAFTLNRILTGSVVESAIGVHDYVADSDPYFVDYLATPVTDFTFQLEKNGSDQLIFRIMLPTRTNDGMLFLGFVYGTVDVSIPDEPVVTLIEVEDFTVVFVCNSSVTITIQTNSGTNLITYHAISTPEDMITYTGQFALPAGVWAFFNNNSGRPIDTDNFTSWGQFGSTCGGAVTFIDANFFCSDDKMQILIGAYGLDYDDVTTAEVSNDGGISWTVFYTAPQPNGNNQEEEHPAWDHTLFPDGQEVIIRIVSEKKGELQRITATVTECPVDLVFIGNVSYDCGTETLSGEIQNNGVGGDFYLQIDPTGGTDDWTNLELIHLDNGVNNFSVVTPIANDTWNFRFRNAADTAGSDVVSTVINCP